MKHTVLTIFQLNGIKYAHIVLLPTVTTIHPQNSFHLAELKLCTCSSVTPIPCPQPGSSLPQRDEYSRNHHHSVHYHGCAHVYRRHIHEV